MTPKVLPKRLATKMQPDTSSDGEFEPAPGGKFRMMVVIPRSSRHDIERAKDLLNTTHSSIVHQAVVWFVRHHPLLIMMRNEEEKLGIDDAIGIVQAMVAETREGKPISAERLSELENMLSLASSLKREATA